MQWRRWCKAGHVLQLTLLPRSIPVCHLLFYSAPSQTTGFGMDVVWLCILSPVKPLEGAPSAWTTVIYCGQSYWWILWSEYPLADILHRPETTVRQCCPIKWGSTCFCGNRRLIGYNLKDVAILVLKLVSRIPCCNVEGLLSRDRILFLDADVRLQVFSTKLFVHSKLKCPLFRYLLFRTQSDWLWFLFSATLRE